MHHTCRKHAQQKQAKQVFADMMHCSCRERAQQKQAKQGAAEPSKQNPQAETAQPIENLADLSSGSALVEDQLLPKSKLQPPKPDPVGKGMLSAQELSGMGFWQSGKMLGVKSASNPA